VYNLVNFLRNLALSQKMVVKIRAKVVTHARCTVFQMAGVAVPHDLFRRVLVLIADLRPGGLARC
jgi:hypothetical protein